MKLKDYLKQFEGMNGELEVVYSIDDEGNAFHPINCGVCVGNFYEGDFISKEQFEDYEESEGDKLIPNAICIN